MSSSNKSHYIFDLIKSMTQAEKRYFKMFVSIFEQKNKTYTKLYNAIDKQHSYDEKALKKKFANESFINHFAVVKNKLFEAILKALRIYHSNDQYASAIVHQYKKNYILLVRRGMNELARIQLQKAKKLAEENELFSQNISITNLQNYERINSLVYENIEPNIDFNMPFKYIEQLENHQLYVTLLRKLELILVKNSIRTEDSINKLKEIVNDPIFNKEPLSIQATRFKLTTQIKCDFELKNYKKAYIGSKKLVTNTIKHKSDKALTNPIIDIYYNHVFASIRSESWEQTQKDIDKYLDIVDKAKKEQLKHFNSDVKIFEVNYISKLQHHIFHGNFDKIPSILPEIEKKFQQLEPQLKEPQFWNYTYNLAYSNFIFQNNEGSQKYIIKLLNAPLPKNRKDYYIGTNILNLFNHYELGNYEHLSYQIKNTRELIKRQNYYFEFEKNCIEFLSKLCKVTEDKKDNLFVIYHEKFVELHKKKWELDAFEKFDILWWIKEKISTKNLLVSQKIGRRERA